jgi:hypothetical protein
MPLDRRAWVERWYGLIPDDFVAGRAALSELQDLIDAIAIPEFEAALIGPDGASGGSVRQPGAFAALWGDWLEAWKRYEVEVLWDEVAEGPRAIVVPARQRVTPLEGETAIEVMAATTWVFDGDALVRAEFHARVELALAAGGLGGGAS